VGKPKLRQNAVKYTRLMRPKREHESIYLFSQNVSLLPLRGEDPVQILSPGCFMC